MRSTPHARALRWRREPYRILFPLGAAHGVLAVIPFTLRGAGGGFVALFHSVAQIQGFLTCFVLGFLFTYFPRQTGTHGPTPGEMAAAVALPPAAVASAWVDASVLGYFFWLALVAIALSFVTGRLRGLPTRALVPASFVWIPLSLAAGAGGALLAAVSPIFSGGGAPPGWVIGRGLLVQGLAAGLLFGVGGELLPALTRGEAADVPPPARSRARRLHLLAGAAFFASFPIEVLVQERLGTTLRALVATAVLLGDARIHRPPTLPGLHRRLVWLGAWLVPLGFWMEAAVPRLRGAALHVLFVGGFAQLTLAVATHVVLARGSHPERLGGSPSGMRVMAALLVAAFGARILAGLDLAHVALWLAVAGASFTGAIVAWWALVRTDLRGAQAALAAEDAPPLG